jgi:hypothetical protein
LPPFRGLPLNATTFIFISSDKKGFKGSRGRGFK